MEKTWDARVGPGPAAAWKSRFAGEEVKNRREGKRGRAKASFASQVFHRPRVSAAGVRRPAWGLHHIARPPPHLRSRG
jgi:hypothetical protein